MPHFAIEFEWSRGLGYELVHIKNPTRNLARYPDKQIGSTRFLSYDPDPHWDGIPARTVHLSGNIFPAGRVAIRQKRAPYRPSRLLKDKLVSPDAYRPLEIRPTLFADFAKLDGPEGFLKFASTWGLLFTKARAGEFETVAQWWRAIGTVQRLISSLDTSSEGPSSALHDLTMVSVSVRRYEAGRPSLILRPQTLFDAMLMQLAQIATAGGALRECQNCGAHFAVGTEKRADSKFCSDRCRNKFHYERRIK